MFPDVPQYGHPPCVRVRTWWLTFFLSANIHYDLLRTGSVELTTNKILERGFLDPVRVPPP
jgi:hypothetical protein